MNLSPKAYATLYSPYRPTHQPSRGETVVALLAGGLWALTLASLAWLTFLVGMVAVWGAAAGQPIGDLLRTFFLTVATAAATLIALAFAPGIRRLAPATRLLLLGALACPVPTCLAVVTWAQTG